MGFWVYGSGSKRIRPYTIGFFGFIIILIITSQLAPSIISETTLEKVVTNSIFFYTFFYLSAHYGTLVIQENQMVFKNFFQKQIMNFSDIQSVEMRNDFKGSRLGRKLCGIKIFLKNNRIFYFQLVGGEKVIEKIEREIKSTKPSFPVNIHRTFKFF